ncbi:MAG: PP2C family protein-serine/threonine phosphatase, partial [Myxococcota bacterium]
EVELAAAVQRAFVPSGDIIDCGSVHFSGLWAPAMQCGGDWWSVHKLPDGRVLVLIGDVTGHGVAAAMVTAAAKGCYDVAEKLMGGNFDLVQLLNLLDNAVSLVGADNLHMTCFATLLDPASGVVEYANAGHVVPYICRQREGGGVELGALVARGNPLGTRDAPVYKSKSRELASGDILIWYTDGIVECSDNNRQQFGERRLQRQLRKIDRLGPSPRAVRDHIVRAVAAFQRGQSPDDDITLVVARVV